MRSISSEKWATSFDFVSVIAKNLNEIYGHISVREWMLILLPMLLFLTYLRDMKYLAPFSALGIVAVILATGLVLVFGFIHFNPSQSMFPAFFYFLASTWFFYTRLPFHQPQHFSPLLWGGSIRVRRKSTGITEVCSLSLHLLVFRQFLSRTRWRIVTRTRLCWMFACYLSLSCTLALRCLAICVSAMRPSRSSLRISPT